MGCANPPFSDPPLCWVTAVPTHFHRAPYKCVTATQIVQFETGLPRPALLGVSDSGSRRRLGEVGEGIVSNILITHLEVQIRSGGATAAADSGDGLPAYYAGTFLDQVHLVVAIDGCVVVVVTDDHDVSVAVQRAGKNHRAAIGSVHRGALRRGDVDSLMHRAVANSESRRHHPVRNRPFELARRTLAVIGEGV